MNDRVVLVTGGAGYIGSHACKALARAGYLPVTYDSPVYGHEWAVKLGPLEKGDIIDTPRLADVIAAHKPSAVVHFAASASVGESVEDPAKYYRNNVVGALSLLDAMRENDIDKIVFSSTCATYGIREQVPISEAAPQRLDYRVTASVDAKISVVTVCRNSAKTIGHTLDSFFRQDYREKEFVMVDGASTDETLNIVRSYPQANMAVVSEPDRGICDAMNKGLERFTGYAVGFLNSDDCFHDEHVLSRIAEAREDFDIAFGNIEIVADQVSKRVVRKWRGTPYRCGAFRRGWMPI